MIIIRRSIFGLILALCVVLPLHSPAQSAAVSATLRGIVTDPQSQPVAGCQVLVRNTDFNISRTLVTNDDGAFIVQSLPTGTYFVQVTAPGFALFKAARVALGVGASVRLDIHLKIAAAQSEVTVTARGATLEGNTTAPAVNKDAPEVASTIVGLKVTYMPNRDRDFTQFGRLAPGSITPESGNGLSVAGQRITALGASIDGADFTDPLFGGLRGATDNALFFPQTVVREFQILQAGASAQISGTNAGFLNIATKSGSNKLHGEAFYIGRPATLTASDAFGHSLESRQNELGGSFGGPLVHNRAFFYLGAEHDWVHVPSFVEFAPQIDRAIVSTQQQIDSRSTPTALFGRADFNLGAHNSLSLDADYNHVRTTDLQTNPLFGAGSSRSLATIDNTDLLHGDSLWLSANLNTVLANTRVNQLLAQWSDDHRGFSPNSTSPEIFIDGFGVLGGDALAPLRFTSQRRELTDDLALTRGNTLLHIGASFSYDPARVFREQSLNGYFAFTDLSSFIAATPYRFQQTFLTGDPTYNNAVKQLGAYADLRFRPASSLSISAGIRWDAQFNPSFAPNDLRQFQPRLGLAWNLSPKTTIRASTGLFDAPTPADIFARAFSDSGQHTLVADSDYDPQLLALATAGGLHALAAPPPLSTPNALIAAISNRFRNPRSFQASGSIEQQFTKSISATAGFLHNSTAHLQQTLNTNLFPATYNAAGIPIFPIARPDPTIGQNLTFTSTGHSSYDALLTSISFQLPKRSQLTANYTLSRNRDDESSFGPFAPSTVLDPFHPSANDAFSNLDARHNFNLNAIVNLPLGFKFNPVLIAHSGLPYTTILGMDTQNDGNDFNDRTLLNGQSLPRNLLRQPSFFDLDIRFVKDITLKGEGHHLDLFLDVFNLTNSANRNFGSQALSFYGNSPLFAPNTNLYGSATQVQFTARLVAF